MNYEQTKMTNLFLGIFGFVIGCSILLITNAQEPTIKIPTSSYQSNSWDWAVKRTESIIWQSDVLTKWTDKIWHWTTILNKWIETGEYKQDKWTKEEVKRPVQPVLRTGDKKVFVRWFPEDSIANLVANKAYKERWLDFVLTLIWENGSFQLDRQSDCVSNWIRERSFWLCQLSYKYHKPFIDSPDFKDWEKQTAYCIEVRDDAKRKWTMPFNAYWKRNNYKDRIIYK